MSHWVAEHVHVLTPPLFSPQTSAKEKVKTCFSLVLISLGFIQNICKSFLALSAVFKKSVFIVLLACCATNQLASCREWISSCDVQAVRWRVCVIYFFFFKKLHTRRCLSPPHSPTINNKFILRVYLMRRDFYGPCFPPRTHT